MLYEKKGDSILYYRGRDPLLHTKYEASGLYFVQYKIKLCGKAMRCETAVAIY